MLKHIVEAVSGMILGGVVGFVVSLVFLLGMQLL